MPRIKCVSSLHSDVLPVSVLSCYKGKSQRELQQTATELTQ